MNRLELLSALLSLAAAAGYAAGGILHVISKKEAARICMMAGWGCNLGIFIKNMAINGYAPFASMYQVLSVLSLCFLPIGLLLVRRHPKDRWLIPYFCIPAALPLVGTLFMDKQLKWALVPALQSGWFVPHVLSYMLSYSLAAVAFLLTVTSLFQEKRTGRAAMKPSGPAAKIQKEDKEAAIYRILRVAFPFMTTGLCFGALWADEVWGSFWQWDVKEIWSLITALCYLCYFHWRRLPNGRKTARLWCLIGFAALVVTFLCVNLLPSVEESFHLYA